MSNSGKALSRQKTNGRPTTRDNKAQPQAMASEVGNDQVFFPRVEWVLFPDVDRGPSGEPNYRLIRKNGLRTPADCLVLEQRVRKGVDTLGVETWVWENTCAFEHFTQPPLSLTQSQQSYGPNTHTVNARIDALGLVVNALVQGKGSKPTTQKSSGRKKAK